MEGLEEGVAEDAVVSQSPREFQSLWTMREPCADYVRTRDHIIGGDVSVPLHRIEAFLGASQVAVRRIDPETEFLVFGHLGDDNLHHVIATPKARDAMRRYIAWSRRAAGRSRPNMASGSTSLGCICREVRPRSDDAPAEGRARSKGHPEPRPDLRWLMRKLTA